MAQLELSTGHNMDLAAIEEDASELWDRYVEPRTHTVTDLYAWRRVVHGAYGMRSHYFGAYEGSDLVGALALYEVHHPLFGHYLTTAPFGNDGGLHADSDEALELLLSAARRLAQERDVSYLLVRTRGHALEGFAVDRRYQTAVVDLSPGPEALWTNGIPGKTRNQVRRGEKEGFTIADGAGEIRAFFNVFHAHMKELGSPAHNLRFYRLIAQYLGEKATFIVVRDGDELAAGALLFAVNGTAANHHTVSLRRYNRRCSNYLIYWDMIKRACNAECHSFDLGRSLEASSNLAFKKNWNPEVIPLTYNYFLQRMKTMPFVDPRNSRYRLAIGLWKRLPLVLTKALGPQLITGLP